MQNLGESAEVVAKLLKAGISNLMNLAGQGGDPLSGVFFVNFNQDCSSLAVGSKNGYRLFALNSTDKLELIYQCVSDGDENSTSPAGEIFPSVDAEIAGCEEKRSWPKEDTIHCNSGSESIKDKKDICIVERLFCSSLVAIVSLSSPRRLTVCHFKRNTEICNYSYSNTILAVKLNRSRLVVCLEESLYIHNIKDMKVMHTIRDTPPNLAGLCALSVNTDNCFLAYPGSNAIGEVQIFDADNLQAKIMIPAHDNPIAALAFDATGTKIATASDKGTVIRVYGVTDGAKLFEFRRGMKRCVSIYSLAFSLDSNFLCASSNTETVHIFKLEGPKESAKPIEETPGWIGYVGKALMTSASYLPTQVTDMFTQGRAFATVHLPFAGLKNVCAIVTIQKLPRVLVASSDGFLYIYNLDVNEGGDCAIVKQHRLDGRPDVPTTVAPFETATTCAPAASAPKERASAGGNSSSSSGGSGTGSTYSAALRKPDKHGSSSYAGIVRGQPLMTAESDKCREMALALELPPKGGLGLDDDNEFPPIS